MAIAATLLATISSSTDATSYTSGSFTPTSGAILKVVYAVSMSPAICPYITVSDSLGATDWKEESNFLWSGQVTPVRRNGLWWHPAVASSQTITLTCVDSHGGGTTAIGMIAFIFEVTDVNTTWPIEQLQWGGDDVNTSSQNAANVTDNDVMTLPSALDSDNRPVFFQAHRANEASGFRASWTELGDTTATTPAMGASLQIRTDTFEATGSASWTSSADHGEMIWEVNHSGTTAPVLSPKIIGSYYTRSVASSSVTVGMPDGMLSGELLVAIIAVDQAATCSEGSGNWTSVTDNANGGDCRLKVFGKLVGAGSDTLTLTIGSAVDVVVQVLRIAYHGVISVGSNIIVGTAATGTTDQPDPPSVSPPVTDDWLVLAVAGLDDDNNVGAGGVWWPTDYFGVGQEESAASATSCMIQVASRRFNTGSAVDPGNFQISGTEQWVAQTLLIPPFHDDDIVNVTTVTGTGTAQTISLTISETATPGTRTATVQPIPVPDSPSAENARPAVVVAICRVQDPTIITVSAPTNPLSSRYFAPSYIRPATGARVISNF